MSKAATKPSLKISLSRQPVQPNYDLYKNHYNPLPGPESGELSELVTAALRTCPGLRRNQPDFYFCNTEAQPVAPPPTPTYEGLLAGAMPLTPSSMASSNASTPVTTPRSVKKIMFADEDTVEGGHKVESIKHKLCKDPSKE